MSAQYAAALSIPYLDIGFVSRTEVPKMNAHTGTIYTVDDAPQKRHVGVVRKRSACFLGTVDLQISILSA